MKKSSSSHEGGNKLKRGPWTPEEDQKLLAYIKQHGHGSWRFLPKKAGLQRCGKSCRLRWTNYLRPDIKRGKFSLEEERTIIQLHALLGNRWSAIATHLPKRTDNEIKNYWNTHLKKRLALMGIDPATHKPSRAAAASNQLSHMAQWERTRLEAEARLVASRRAASAAPPPPPLSSEQILKKMPTTFAPPRCPDIRLFAESDLFFKAQYMPRSDGSQAIQVAGAVPGQFSGEFGGGGENIDEVMGRAICWSEVLDFLNCGPSNLPVF